MIWGKMLRKSIGRKREVEAKERINTPRFDTSFLAAAQELLAKCIEL
jgi:hypothetical protein